MDFQIHFRFKFYFNWKIRDIDRAEDVLEQVTDQMQQFEEIAGALSTPMASILDGTDFEQELEDLDNEMVAEEDDELANLEVHAPSQQRAPPKPVSQEDDFARLQAEMELQ